MEWLEEQAGLGAMTTAACPPIIPYTIEAGTTSTRLEARPLQSNVKSMVEEVVLELDAKHFLALPQELRAPIYGHFWAHTLSSLEQRNMHYTHIDSGNPRGTTSTHVPARRQLYIDNSILFAHPDVVRDFYDTVLHELMPIRATFDDRIGNAKCSKDQSTQKVTQAVNLRSQPLCSQPIARDPMQRVRRLSVKINIVRPDTVKGIGYGVCDPVYERMNFINEVEKWLACVPLLQHMSLIVESHLEFKDGVRLGAKWEWLLPLLDPLKKKFTALKFIMFDDTKNFVCPAGTCWTFKDPETGKWSALREMEAHDLATEDVFGDMEKSGLSPVR